ncbi:hypothetical protein IC235_15560 [Hymenobacter sp. BT664]|uniref:Pentapeptide MXKDX repeat protein n=1 Tax=Hymenobacter montanus TaxID=2771359 RepID=A0A927BFH3_9BACT|nr:hypothetical protein [Hymenobacter montanus]MBD2769305.1 hypothetical protein [Hymenobacter montanus]
MKNFLKLASVVALSGTFLAAHAQQGDGKMTKKEEKSTESKTVSKDKMHDDKMGSGKMSPKAKSTKTVKSTTKEKM